MAKPAAVVALQVDAGDLAAPALRAFFNITQRSPLGNPPPSIYFKWKKELADSLPWDVLERIGHVLGVYKALQIPVPDAERAAHAPDIYAVSQKLALRLRADGFDGLVYAYHWDNARITEVTELRSVKLA